MRKAFIMKNLTALFLSVMLIISLTACGKSGGTEPVSTAVPTEVPAESVSENEQYTGKILVVYFSASGNTERVAKDIAAVTGADLFEVVPAEPYTDDDLNYNNSSSRVSREHDNEALRNVELAAAEASNWGAYDTVFIGYPIWWGIAAWPVSSFAAANDFAGKTVIPFATSASSGMGNSGTLLAQTAGSGNWQLGHRFASGASAEDVQAWVKGLDLG